MKRAAAFLLLLACVSANALNINAQISVTTNAQAYTVNGTTPCTLTAVSSAVTAINASYATQGITTTIVPTITTAYSAPPDSGNLSMPLMYRYMNSSVAAWTARTLSTASMGIVVSLPADTGGQPTTGVFSTGVPTKTADATAAVNCKDLANQLERAISHILGDTVTDGYSARIRTYPYQGDNICFHTRTAAPSDPSTLVSLLSYWSVLGEGNQYDSVITQSATSTTSCELYRLTSTASPGGNHSSASWVSSSTANDNGSNATCNIYSGPNSTGTIVAFLSMPHTAMSGATSLTCGSPGDFELTQYSCSGQSACTPYRGYVIGDGTHNAVADMNTHASAVASFYNNNGNLKNAASILVDLMFRFMHLF